MRHQFRVSCSEPQINQNENAYSCKMAIMGFLLLLWERMYKKEF